MGVRATDVKNLCAHYGRVVSIKIVGNRQGNEPKIYAHVTMESAASASAAAQHLDKYFFNGRIIEVKKVRRPIDIPFALSYFHRLVSLKLHFELGVWGQTQI